MRLLSVSHHEALGLLQEQLRDFTTVVGALSDLELLEASLCHGWSRVDLLVHVRMGLEEVLGGCVAQTDQPPDHDAASYWSCHPDDRDADPVPHILWLRRTAAAYARPAAAVRHLEDVASRLTPALQRMPDQPVRFQGKVMASGDFLGTWVVELAVHQLDLNVATSHAPPPGLRLARRTIEAIAEHDLARELDDQTVVLAGLGRIPPPAQVADGYPISL
jgi:hypothetical protein